MAGDRLPTDFIISAHIRTAAQQGVPIVIRQRGDNNVGTILLKINLLNGTSRVLSQVRFNDQMMWSPVSKTDPMKEADAENYLARQAKIDPDCWMVEIEDKQGRIWFEGKIANF